MVGLTLHTANRHFQELDLLGRAIPAAGAPRCPSSMPGYSEWPVVSVMVVNYNGGERLVRCLESLVDDSYPNRELLVVDNASTDQSLAAITDLATKYPRITVIRSSRNLGYAGGVNLALTATTGTYIAVLNMDVMVERGWLEPLVAFLDANKEVGAVNPLITLADGRRINAAGQEVHVSGLGFNRWLGRPANTISQTPIRVTGIHGSAFQPIECYWNASVEWMSPDFSTMRM